MVPHSNNSVTTRYFHTDHLGSLAVITNGTGAVVERDSYEARGRAPLPDRCGRCSHGEPSSAIELKLLARCDTVATRTKKDDIYQYLITDFDSAIPRFESWRPSQTDLSH